MSLYTALSGLNAAQSALSVTSNNIANAGTLGFRRSRAEFADLFNNSPTAVAGRQIGAGVQLSRVAHLFSQGSIAQTGSSLDLAISGQGFFAVQPPNNDGTIAYTRAGAFGLGPDGVIRNASGASLLFYPTSRDGTSLSSSANAAAPVSVPSTTGTANPTRSLTLALTLPTDPAEAGAQAAVPPTAPFDPADSSTWAYSTRVPVLGEDGVQQEAAMYMVRVANPDASSSDTVFRAMMVLDGRIMPGDPETLTFDEAGALTGGATLTFAGARSISVDFSGSALSDRGFGVTSVTQDGTTLGALVALSVDPSGVLWSSYSNGDRLALGQVAMTSFANPAQLRQIGNATYMQTEESGQPRFGFAGAEGMGNLQSASLEHSNVDLTAELVDLISSQRNYQASAKAMETASSLLQTVLNIRS